MYWFLIILSFYLVLCDWSDRFLLCQESCQTVLPVLDKQKLNSSTNMDELNEMDADNRAKCMRSCLITFKNGPPLIRRLASIRYQPFNYEIGEINEGEEKSALINDNNMEVPEEFTME